MFVFWLNNSAEPTCEFLIQAVGAMGRRDVVTMLCQKYYGELVVPEVIDIKFHVQYFSEEISTLW